jgi:hypothetical protein
MYGGISCLKNYTNPTFKKEYLNVNFDIIPRNSTVSLLSALPVVYPSQPDCPSKWMMPPKLPTQIPPASLPQCWMDLYDLYY